MKFCQIFLKICIFRWLNVWYICPLVYTDVGMIAIIVVCVGFLLFMIILGVIRIRAAHRRTQVVQVEPEMEWDNDMNIIVNPMEQETHPLHVSINHVKFYILRILVCVHCISLIFRLFKAWNAFCKFLGSE